MAKKREVLKVAEMKKVKVKAKTEPKVEVEVDTQPDDYDEAMDKIDQTIADIDKQIEAERIKKAEAAVEAAEPEVVVEPDAMPETEVEASEEFTSDEALSLASQADDLQKQLEHAAEVIARKQKEVEQMRKKAAEAEAKAKEEARKKAEAEAKAKAEAEEAKRLEEEAKKARDARVAPVPSVPLVPPVDLVPGKAFRFWNPEIQDWDFTTDVYKADQICPNGWRPYNVWYQNGKVVSLMTPSEICVYFPD